MLRKHIYFISILFLFTISNYVFLSQFLIALPMDYNGDEDQGGGTTVIAEENITVSCRGNQSCDFTLTQARSMGISVSFISGGYENGQEVSRTFSRDCLGGSRTCSAQTCQPGHDGDCSTGMWCWCDTWVGNVRTKISFNSSECYWGNWH